MDRTYWTETADRDGGADVLGEDENGVLWVPSRRRDGWWDRRLDLRRPAHWPAYWRSRRRGSIAFIETT
jgi:hypothetical protein